MSDVIRPEEHEIDTKARRLVPTLLPSAWEHREPGGRDYGIDMQVELFEAGRATGNLLFCQIKGCSDNVRDDVEYHAYDLKNNTLKYSELFAVPFLLVLCPVEQRPARFYYVWLQEYISVVLDYDNPTWRNNTTTTRVKIPIRNKMPGDNDRLQHIAGYPRRVRTLTNLVHLQHELESAVNNHIMMLKHGGTAWFLDHALEVVDRMCASLELHNDESDSLLWGLMKWEVLDPVRDLLTFLKAGKELTPEELRTACADIRLPDPQSQDQLMAAATEELRRRVRSVLTTVVRQFDTQLRRALFEENDSHEF
jgi:hypothetical protein